MNEVLKNKIKRFFRFFGIRITRSKYYKFPYDQHNFQDIRTNENIIIFDVGANIGQSALWFKNSFPHATIHAFEPFQAIFELLSANTRHVSEIFCHKVALGETEKLLDLPKINDAYCQTSQVVEKQSNNNIDKNTLETIEVKIIDNFCEENSIDKIDILKTDTEGFDLSVLRGAEKLLKNRKINYIISEVSIISNDKQHTDLFELQRYLAEYGFILYSLYDIAHNPSNGRLEYFNALFKKS